MMEIKTIKDIAKFIRTGKTPPTQEVKYFDGEVNWYTPGDLDKGKYLSTSKRTLTNLAFEDKKAVVFPKNTLIVGCIGDIGKLGITVDDCSSNQQLTGIYPNDNVDVNYLYYWFKGNKSLIDSYANNAVVPILNNRTLETIKLPIPPLSQQQKIANILDAADALRKNDKALVAKYDELTQALFLDMFGDPVSNPKNLPKIKLGELGKWQSGGTPSRSKSEYYNGRIPWLSSGELNEMYVSESKEHITETAIKESSTRLIEKGSLLLGMYDTAALKSTISTIDITCNQAIAYSKLDDKLVSTVYAYFIIQIGKEDYKKLQRGVRQKNLNLSMIKNLEILLPHLKLQNQFAERVAVIEEQKAIAQKSLEHSESLFNSLLQKAFKGELV